MIIQDVYVIAIAASLTANLALVCTIHYLVNERRKLRAWCASLTQKLEGKQ